MKPLIVEEGENVVLFGHSSGGFVATESATPELQAKNRKAKGLAEGVIGIFYTCAFVIPVEESIHNFFQPKDGSPPVAPHFSKFHVRFISNSAPDESRHRFKKSISANTFTRATAWQGLAPPTKAQNTSSTASTQKKPSIMSP